MFKILFPVAAVLAQLTSAAPSASPGGLKNMVYFTNWGIYGNQFDPQDLNVNQISHVLYAFGDIDSKGQVISSDAYSDIEKHYPGDSWNDQGQNAYGCVKQLYMQKKKNRKLKTLLSIGGWTYSQTGKFTPATKTQAGRKLFASTAVKHLADWGFDGIDIDWEYPVYQQEALNFVLLLQECRAALDSYARAHGQNYHYLLTVAASAGPSHYGKLALKSMDKYVDTWHLMAYDYAGSWDTTSGHQANIYADTTSFHSTKFSTSKAVDDYISHGISPHKIILGLPLYGRSFDNTAGMGKPFNGVAQASNEGGIWLYKELPRPGATMYYDKYHVGSYSYDRQKQELVSFDDPQSTKVKASYIKQKGLGGAFFWEASGDKTGDQSLVGTMAHGLGSLDQSLNQLSYPSSQYNNIKQGVPGQ